MKEQTGRSLPRGEGPGGGVAPPRSQTGAGLTGRVQRAISDSQCYTQKPNENCLRFLS